MDCFVASAPLRKRFAFVAGNDELVMRLLRFKIDRRSWPGFPDRYGLGCVLQRVGVVDRYVQLPLINGGKQGVGALEQSERLPM